MCRLIIRQVEDKNPPDNERCTTLDKASENGHKGIVRLIKNNMV